MTRISLIQPDDWHVHLRDGPALADTVAATARQFGRAIVMPNLKPPVTTVALALDYRRRIVTVLPPETEFEPLMTLYLTESTPADEVMRVAQTPEVVAFKLYPAGATTNSQDGVGKLERIYPLLEVMERHGVPLLIHGEVVDTETDIFDRERVFIDRELTRIHAQFPTLRVVLEHITTKDAVDFVTSASTHVAATITAHHLLFNRNAMLVGGIRPHHYCLPILKSETHRLALLDAATSGSAKFFLGTDSAPHSVATKETVCGCAGCYTAPTALELYATAFEMAGRLEQLEQFASLSGPRFYGLPTNTKAINLERVDWRIPTELPLGENAVRPLMAGETLRWKFLD